MTKKKTINIKDINADFGEDTEPKDEKLLELLKKAYKGELLCYKALIKTEGIRPFSDFRPKLSEVFRENFRRKLRERKFPEIYVYQEGDKFIMSDDYNAYYL